MPTGTPAGSGGIAPGADRAWAPASWWGPLAAYVALDVLATGLGMGVPFFCILLGLPVGWYLARRARREGPSIRRAPRRVFRGSCVAAGVTCALMIAVWGPHVPKLWQPGFDAAAWGIPLILFGSRASLAGWLALMIAISPLLQLGALTVTGAAVLAYGPPDE